MFVPELLELKENKNEKTNKQTKKQKGTGIVVKTLEYTVAKPVALNKRDQKRITESKDRERVIIFADG